MISFEQALSKILYLANKIDFEETKKAAEAEALKAKAEASKKEA